MPSRWRARKSPSFRVETAEQTDASGKLAASWIRDEKLETAFPNPPTITSGNVVTHQNGVTVK